MFDSVTCTILQHFTTKPPRHVCNRSGPWMSILVTLFPPSQDYALTPQGCIAEDSHHTPYLLLEVAKMTYLPSVQLRTVLIVAIMDGPDWRAGIPLLETEINRQIVASFNGPVRRSAISMVYWIGVIGPHWRYGVKEDNERDPKPLIAWHDTAHDQASYDTFQHLTALIAKM
ncbi:hypothetical protein EI94DRAFT_1714142 [Lactarius quietus]|nr:hypothetical protein EI94DRAFT_1714142 [Lactarius quietus]